MAGYILKLIRVAHVENLVQNNLSLKFFIGSDRGTDHNRSPATSDYKGQLRTEFIDFRPVKTSFWSRRLTKAYAQLEAESGTYLLRYQQ